MAKIMRNEACGTKAAPEITAGHETQVIDWMGQLKDAIEGLDAAASSLVCRLGSVLRCDPVEPGKDVPEPCLVPLAESLRDRVRHVQAVARTLRDAGNRLEL